MFEFAIQTWQTSLPIANNIISHVCIVGNCWQWANFKMGPNEQNQHFAKSRQKLCLYIHVLVLRRGLPSLDGKRERFVTKKCKTWLPNSSQTDYRSCVCSRCACPIFSFGGTPDDDDDAGSWKFMC